jgi:polygalacturonase
MSSPNLDRAIRIKTNSVRGGTIENIFVRNIEVGEVKEAILAINFLYEEGDAGSFTPSVNNVVLENISSKKSNYALWIKAYERSPITGLKIINCNFNNVGDGNIIENLKDPVFNSVQINGKDFTIK